MKDTTRVNFELGRITMTRLKKLKKQTDASGYAEVLRNALKAYERELTEAKK